MKRNAMKKIAFIYHSGYGHTKKITDHMLASLQQDPSIEATLLTTEEATKNLDVLDNYTTLVFCSPTYMGGPSAQFKAFADASSKKWFTQKWKNKLAAGFTNSGTLAGDKLGTLHYFTLLAAQHGMIWISLGILPATSKSGHGATSDAINRLGGSLGLETQSDNASPDQTPAPGDLKTAELFAQRLAEITKSWNL